MKESEVIIANQIPPSVYYAIVKESAMYALISIPFTVNRMSIDDLERRIENITKGKIAEKLFEYYCLENHIPADFKSTRTPFYQKDRRDFLLDKMEWDIKNNFIHHDGNLLTDFKYTHLPALVPDKNDNDQWEKRNYKYFPESNGVCFLFTFLKATNKNSHQQFIEIKLSVKQKEFLQDLTERYSGHSYEEKPYDEHWFWSKMKELKDDIPSLLIHDFPNLIITGVADSNLWDQFKPTNSGQDSNFINYIKPQWYQVINKDGQSKLKFMNGTIWTRIRNATLPVSELKAFKY